MDCRTRRGASRRMPLVIDDAPPHNTRPLSHSPHFSSPWDDRPMSPGRPAEGVRASAPARQVTGQGASALKWIELLKDWMGKNAGERLAVCRGHGQTLVTAGIARWVGTRTLRATDRAVTGVEPGAVDAPERPKK